MANLDKEINDALAKVKRLQEKKRQAEAKERARFAEAVMTVVETIEDANTVSVADLLDRAQALINEQDNKRRAAAEKAAAKRRAASRAVTDFEQPEHAFNEENNHAERGDYGD